MRTQRAALLTLRWWTSCLSLEDRRRACVVAVGAWRQHHGQLCLQTRRDPSSAMNLTLLDCKVLRRTLTVCSCAATSSIVFGRL